MEGKWTSLHWLEIRHELINLWTIYVDMELLSVNYVFIENVI